MGPFPRTVRIRSCLMAIALLTATALLLPVPASSDAQVQPMPGIPGRKTPMKDYFPLQTGAWWKYRSVSAVGGPGQQSARVVAMTVNALGAEKQADGSYLEVVQTQVGQLRFLSLYNKLNKGVVLLQSSQLVGDPNPTRYQPAKIFIKNPLLPGESWTWQGRTGSGTVIQETGKIVGEETVVVPAGRFRAIKVVVLSETRDRLVVTRLSETHWFAESVGLVKQTVQSSVSQSSLELLDYSFKPQPQ